MHRWLGGQTGRAGRSHGTIRHRGREFCPVQLADLAGSCKGRAGHWAEQDWAGLEESQFHTERHSSRIVQHRPALTGIRIRFPGTYLTGHELGLAKVQRGSLLAWEGDRPARG